MNQSPIFKTKLGSLYNSDCLQVLPEIDDNSVDLVFADPPFNCNKKYDSYKDNVTEKEYLSWCNSWIIECIRVLKVGGSLFIYNLPKWNIKLGNILEDNKMIFRHWISINMKACLPIPKKLYPSHYSLLYYTKGLPIKFHKIRIPIEVCRHCGKEIKDYGGHKKSMNPNGVNLSDVWNDVSPVRHNKFKSDKRKSNQLSSKILFRVIMLATDIGDVVLDPFGGSGTTYDICEKYNRKWIGIEIGSCQDIIDRLTLKNIKSHEIKDHVT